MAPRLRRERDADAGHVFPCSADDAEERDGEIEGSAVWEGVEMNHSLDTFALESPFRDMTRSESVTRHVDFSRFKVTLPKVCHIKLRQLPGR